MMTYEEARVEFKILTGNKYRVMYHELLERGAVYDDEVEQKVRLYVDPSITTEVHNTWEDALSEMKLLLYPIEQPVTVQSPNEVITITEKHQEPDPSIVKAMTIEAPLNEMEK